MRTHYQENKTPKFQSWLAVVAMVPILIAFITSNANSEITVPSTVANCKKGNAATDSLRSIMCDLGVAFGAVADSVWRSDRAGIAAYAKLIADHPHVNIGEKQRIQKALGTDFGLFVAKDRAVHQAARTLENMALASENEVSLDSLVKQSQILQNACLSCHSAFQKKLR